MSSFAFQLAAFFAVLAISAPMLIHLPGEGMKGLARGLLVSLALGLVAAALIAVARAFGS